MRRYARNVGGHGFIPPLATPMVTRKEWKRKDSTYCTWCSIFHWQKARNNARLPDTTDLRWKQYCQYCLLRLVVIN